MDPGILSNLWIGFQVAVSPWNLFYCLVGVLLGTLIGVLPGIGPVATIAMLLPITFNLNPVAALIMLAGIYYGAQYGGSTTAILVNIPGESSSVVTCLDGYQMARQGRAGPALAIAALGSFFAGCVATLIIAVAAPPLAEVALKFGPAEYFSLMVFGLVAATVLAHGSLVKAVAMVVFGLLLGLVGTDVNSGVLRFAFGIPELLGLDQMRAWQEGRPPPVARLKTGGLYSWLRHPMYVGVLLGVWATPRMTTGHLLFAVATTAYILVALQFEERDLANIHGEAYKAYQKKVAMLVPLPRRKG